MWTNGGLQLHAALLGHDTAGLGPGDTGVTLSILGFIMMINNCKYIGNLKG